MDTARQTQDLTSRQTRLDVQWRRQWLLLVSVPLLTTVVLAALLPLMRTVLPEVWPWAGTDRLLAAALSVMLLVFAWHATVQQRRILRLRDDLVEARFRVKEERRRHRSRMMALCALSQAIGDENDPREVFDTLTQLCQEMFGSDRASLMVIDHRSGKLVVRSAVGIAHPERVVGIEQELDEGIAGWVAQNREPLLVGPDGKHPSLGDRSGHGQVRSAMVVPLVVRDHVAGVLSVANDRSEIDYDEDDLTTLRVFAETAEYCIRHAENADWMRGLIHSLRDARSRTPGTGEQGQPRTRSTAARSGPHSSADSRGLECLWAITSGAHIPLRPEALTS